MQVLASQLHFLANRNAGQAIPPLFWPVNCMKIGGHVALLSDPTVNCLYCGQAIRRHPDTGLLLQSVARYHWESKWTCIIEWVREYYGPDKIIMANSKIL